MLYHVITSSKRKVKLVGEGHIYLIVGLQYVPSFLGLTLSPRSNMWKFILILNGGETWTQYVSLLSNYVVVFRGSTSFFLLYFRSIHHIIGCLLLRVTKHQHQLLLRNYAVLGTRHNMTNIYKKTLQNLDTEKQSSTWGSVMAISLDTPSHTCAGSSKNSAFEDPIWVQPKLWRIRATLSDGMKWREKHTHVC